MEVSHRKEDSVLVLSMQGKLGTFFGVKELEEKLQELRTAEIKFVIFDMTEVSYISSAAIRIILQTEKSLTMKKGGLIIVGLQEACRQVFTVTGIIDIIPVVDSVEDAHKYITQNK